MEKINKLIRPPTRSLYDCFGSRIVKNYPPKTELITNSAVVNRSARCCTLFDGYEIVADSNAVLCRRRHRLRFHVRFYDTWLVVWKSITGVFPCPFYRMARFVVNILSARFESKWRGGVVYASAETWKYINVIHNFEIFFKLRCR